MMHIRISPNTKFQNKLAIFIYWTRFAVEIGKSEHNHSILHLQIERKQQHFPCWGSDALVHLAEPGQKKYSTTFIWGHPFKKYVSYDRC